MNERAWFHAIGEGHRTTERFDRTLNRWVWMDPMFGVRGARPDGPELLNMAELAEARQRSPEITCRSMSCM